MLHFLLLIWLSPAIADSATDCLAFLTKIGITEPYKKGHSSGPENLVNRLRRVHKNAKITMLGEGGEAAVFRIETPGKPTRVARVYKDYSAGLKPSDYFDFEWKAFLVLKRFKQGGDRFRFPSGFKKGKQKYWLEYDDVQGYELLWFLEKAKGAAPRLHKKLVNQYNERLKRMAQDLKAAGWNTKIKPATDPEYGSEHGLLELKGVEGQYFSGPDMIDTSPKNIILDPRTEEMTFIDVG